MHIRMYAPVFHVQFISSTLEPFHSYSSSHWIFLGFFLLHFSFFIINFFYSFHFQGHTVHEVYYYYFYFFCQILILALSFHLVMFAILFADI